MKQSKQAHTPTPWKVGKTADKSLPILANVNGNGIDTRIAEVFPKDWHESKANAAFIVRACNSHESLLKALKFAMDKLGIGHDVVDEAIAKAESK